VELDIDLLSGPDVGSVLPAGNNLSKMGLNIFKEEQEFFG
jgi:hypothetical protein